MKSQAIFPVPPSANAMWKHSQRGVFASPAYTAWTEEASLYARQQLDKFTGKVEIVIVVKSGDEWRWNRDVDNIIKPTVDMLVKSERIQGDTVDILRRVTCEFMTLKSPINSALLFTRITPYVEPDEEFESGFREVLMQLLPMPFVRLAKHVGADAGTPTTAGTDQQRGIPGANRRNSKTKKEGKAKNGK